MSYKELDEYNEFEAMLNEYLPPEKTESNKGKVIGKIAEEDRNYMYLDAVGQPTVIRVKKEELEGNQIGDEVEVMIVGELEDGELLLGSRKRVLMEQGSKKLVEAQKNESVIQGKFIKEIKGGYIIEFMGHQGFLPNSLSRLPENGIVSGDKLDVIVKDIKEDKKGEKIVFSRKEIAEKELEGKLEQLSIGDVFKGEVIEVLSFGIGVKNSGVRGFVHMSELSWEKVGKIEELYKVGDIVTGKVKSVDLEKKQLKLSVKEMSENPWKILQDKYKEGDIIEGTVSRVEPYGVFIELVKGIEGLVHVSDFTWNNKKINAKDFVKIGDIVKVQIVNIDEKGRKVQLGIKQLSPDPWVGAEENYFIGNRVNGKIAEIKDFGVFVEDSRGMTIFVHQSDIFWLGEEKNPVNIGDKVELEITDLDFQERKIKGSIKNTRKSPWDKAMENYKVGDIIEKPIKTIIDSGVFITLERGVDGFIPTAMLGKENVKKAEDLVKIGDVVKAEIVEINDKAQKLKLSIKKVLVDAEKAAEEEMLQKYSVSSSEE